MVIKVNDRNRVSILPPNPSLPSQSASILSTEYTRNASGCLLRNTQIINLPNIKRTIFSQDDGQNLASWEYHQNEDSGGEESGYDGVVQIEDPGPKKRKNLVHLNVSLENDRSLEIKIGPTTS